MSAIPKKFVRRELRFDCRAKWRSWMIVIRKCIGLDGVIRVVERKNKEKKLVLVIKATLLSSAVKDSRETGQPWVVM